MNPHHTSRPLPAAAHPLAPGTRVLTCLWEPAIVVAYDPDPAMATVVLQFADGLAALPLRGLVWP